jgi:RNA polymerase sigma-70 factor (ECF subfamily)
LNEVADWQNQAAWRAFQSRYDPLLARWCRSYGLDDDSSAEIRQRIWIEVAERMRTFQYDPTQTFRGWLRRVCRSRVIDFLRQRERYPVLPLNIEECRDDAVAPGTRAANKLSEAGDDDLARDFLRDESERVQRVVRNKVKPESWDAFWLVAVCDWTVERTALSLGMTHTAVYAARERVARMLREHGTRISDLRPADS